jgi:exosortase family protein XrtF
LYGLYITSYNLRPDSITRSVAQQTGIVLNACGYSVGVEDRQTRPTSDITYFGKAKLSIYEGCNGLNTIIIFVAFVFAFGPISRPLWWFVPLGILIIHFANLCRIVLLFLVSEYMPKAMYFTHKYFFTGILYVVIFALWLWWVRSFSSVKKREDAQ